MAYQAVGQIDGYKEPLIKSYLFVRITVCEQTEALITKGIPRFIYFEGEAAPMPDRQIKDLRLVMTSLFELEVTGEDLLPGEYIAIKAGALKGMTGEVISYRSRKQLAQRLEWLGCSFIIHVGFADQQILTFCMLM